MVEKVYWYDQILKRAKEKYDSVAVIVHSIDEVVSMTMLVETAQAATGSVVMVSTAAF